MPITTLARVVTRLGSDVNVAVQSMLFLPRPGREEQTVCRLAHQTVAEAQPPRTVELQYLTIGFAQLSQERARRGVERINSATAEVADEQAIAESPKVSRRKRNPPGCIQIAASGDPADQLPIRVEDIYEPETGTSHIIATIRILLREGHLQFALDVSYPERRVARLNVV